MALAAALGGVVPGAAQQVRELGITGVVTASDPALVVGGGYAALRTSRRTRVSVAAGAGASGGRGAWRGELLGHFLLNPARRSGAGIYAAGGVAVVGGPVEQGYVVLTLGMEGRPGGLSGWFVEAGVGGGARLAAGYRWRWFPGGLPSS
ncbi:MAG: hypothetical protein H0T86_12930 [Gemmatimonadales bacterium]|nr:hypothetical protein [Gemmatimonadales bacterium]